MTEDDFLEVFTQELELGFCVLKVFRQRLSHADQTVVKILQALGRGQSLLASSGDLVL